MDVGPGARAGYARLRAALPADTWLASDVNADRVERTFRHGSAVGWLSRHRMRPTRWLVAVGPEPQAVGALVRQVLEQPDLPLVSGVSVPADAFDALPDPLRPEHADVWSWWWTRSDPPVRIGEASVVRLAHAEADLAALLAHSRSVYVFPGDPRAVVWAGVRLEGELVSCGAWTEHVPGVPHLASMVTHPDRRGRGLAGDVCAWLTRRAIGESGICTLGMYAANTAARRVYERCGYTLDKTFASGYLPGRRPPADLPPHETEPADAGGTA